MIETLLHFIRLAFATSVLWLSPAQEPDSFFIGSDSTPPMLLIEDEGRTLVRCSERTECTGSRCVYVVDRCEVTK